jgi:hypothetical protein
MRRRLRITIDLEVEGESIQGFITGPGGRHPFSGWLGLLADLDRIVTDGGAGVSAPGRPAGEPARRDPR